MPVEQIITLVVNAGVSTACLIILGKWTGKLVVDSHKASQQRETDLRKTISKLDEDLRTLEREVRGKLDQRLEDNQRIMERFASAAELLAKLLTDKANASI